MMERTSKQVVVVGGGPSGCAAALEAARCGHAVTLVDEHPQTAGAMSLDAPYFYGARFSPLLSSARAVSERVLGANAALMECVEAGVEVLTSTCAWGVFVPGPTSRHLDAPQVALADDARSWCVPFDHLILATGARDLVLSFPGWELAGVLGVMGATKLLAGYQAFEGRNLLVLGSSTAGLAFARQALDLGIGIAGIVEPTDEVEGDADVARSLRERGVPFFMGRTIERALGRQAVEGARLTECAGSGGTDIECDTIVMAFAVAPNVELAAVAGCELAHAAGRGGWCPTVDGAWRTSAGCIHVVGDGAGVTDAMLLDPGIAMEQGRTAARGIGRGTTAGLSAVPVSVAGRRQSSLDAWLASLVAAGGPDVVVCQCEEVTRRALLALAPPRYLAAGNACPRDALQTAVADARLSQDMVKRMTRAGMGHCQGRRCRDQVAMLLARAAGLPLSSVTPGSYRVPVRPLPLAVLQADDEPAGMKERWSYWLHPVSGPPARL